ncbi:MAG: hypothetical protein ACLGIA_03580 [Actinomycetes bacterium]
MNSTSNGSRGGRFLLVPAATFLVGLVLGAALVWVGTDLRGGPGTGGTAAPSGTTTPGGTATSPGNVTATVPAQCLEAAQEAQQVLDLAREAASAVADLDAKRLQTLIEQMQKLEPRVRASADDCRRLAHT